MQPSRNMNEVEVEKQNTCNIMVDCVAGLNVQIVQHSFNIFCVNLKIKCRQPYKMKVKGLEGMINTI